MRRPREYDRNRVLDAAARAQARGRRRDAIALYRWVLAAEPNNPQLQLRLAPLLAQTRQRFDAWVAFRSGVRGLLSGHQGEKALAALEEAVRRLPDELEAWLQLARLQRRAGQRAEARATLRRGRQHFRRRRQRPQAIFLLRRCLELAPDALEETLDLAALLARTDQAAEALRRLDRLAARCRPAQLRRVLWARFRLTGGAGDLWRWLRAPRSGSFARAWAR